MTTHYPDLAERAMAAYRRFVMVFHDLGGYVTEIDGRTYAVVHVRGACRAAYVVRNDGRLRRVMRWPSAIW